MKRALPLLALLLAGACGPFCAPANPPQNVGPGTQSLRFAVTCTSQGQLCTPVYGTYVHVDRDSFSVTYVTPPHCSSVRAIIVVDGKSRVTSGFLGYAGAQGADAKLPLKTGPYTFGPFKTKDHTLTIQAEGRNGGCNDGSVQSWGGTLVFKGATAGPPLPITLG